jgi:hypothetical protein
MILAVTDFATLFGGVGESCFFKVKRLPNGIKDFETAKSRDLKMKGRPSPPKNVQISLTAVAHCWRLSGAASPGYMALDLCTYPD